MSNRLQISKAMAAILRHKANEHNLTVYPGGYVDINELLTIRPFRSCTEETIKSIVNDDDKKRFSLKYDNARDIWQVCATQGHSIEVDLDECSRITNASKFPNIIHGTRKATWETCIKSQGLKKMRRQHIHFATGKLGDQRVTSGCPKYTEVYIYIDLAMAIRDGYEFYEAINGVILTPGNDEGVLPPKYIKKVESTNGTLLFYNC